jgi:hypothetical protein
MLVVTGSLAKNGVFTNFDSENPISVVMCEVAAEATFRE